MSTILTNAMIQNKPTMTSVRKVLQYPVAVRAALFGIGFATAATTHAAPTLHETQTVEIAAPADKVWSVIGNYADLTWVPAVKSSVVTDGNTPGSVRALDLGGGILLERLVRYDAPKRSYTYAIHDVDTNYKLVPVRHFTAMIIVTPMSRDTSKVTWEASFERLDQSAAPGDGKDDAAAKEAVAGAFSLGLGALKANVKSN